MQKLDQTITEDELEEEFRKTDEDGVMIKMVILLVRMGPYQDKSFVPPSSDLPKTTKTIL